VRPATRLTWEHERWLTPGVLSVGAASLASDAGHEMTTSLLPTFLSSTLGAGPAALGAFEGVSDALVDLSKLAGGPLADESVRRTRARCGRLPRDGRRHRTSVSFGDLGHYPRSARRTFGPSR